MEASLGSFRKPNVYYYEGGRVHLIKMQRKPSGSYKSDQPPHSPIIRTNCKEAALLKFQVIRCHNCEHCRIVCLFVTEEIPVYYHDKL